MRYLITGGTGFIGSALLASLPDRASATVVSRRAQSLGDQVAVVPNLASIPVDTRFDAVVNLAGSPIDMRWSKSAKKRITDSRIETTIALVALINRLTHRPKVMLSASAVGYYGSHTQAVLNEESTPKESFTHDLCRQWEQEAFQVCELGVRLCCMRLGVVLGRDGGFLKKTTLPFKLGLGAKLGEGHQYFPWIHLDDVIAAMHYLIGHESCSGPYNFCAPGVLNNQQLTRAMGKALRRPAVLSIPTWVIKILFGEMGEALLLTGNAIQPKRLEAAGYLFRYPTLAAALAEVFDV